MAGSGGRATNYNPMYGVDEVDDYDDLGMRKFSFSGVELLHILGATILLAAILFYAFLKNPWMETIRKGLPIPGLVGAALIISFLGFVLHELGHKFTAQHFGHWSEFRANWFWLLFASAFVLLPPHFPVAAPGATWHTAEERRDQGRISAMGPLINCGIAVAALPFTVGRVNTAPEFLAGVVVLFNAQLALVNLLPFGILDGKAILRWNPLIWAIMIALAIGLFVQGGRLVPS